MTNEGERRKKVSVQSPREVYSGRLCQAVVLHEVEQISAVRGVSRSSRHKNVARPVVVVVRRALLNSFCHRSQLVFELRFLASGLQAVLCG